MAVNWGLAANGNPFADFLEGVQGGMQMRRQRERDDLLAREQAADERKVELLQEKEKRGEEAAKRKQTMEATFGVLNGLKRVEPGQRLQALQRQAPMLARLGIDVNDMLDGTTEEELSDAGIDLVTGEVTKAYEQYFQNDSGIYGVKDGKVTRVQEFEPKPTIVPQGSVALDRNGKPLFTNPKTFAPQRRSGGGGGGGGARTGAPVTPDMGPISWDRK